jgi:hypothetical protein
MPSRQIFTLENEHTSVKTGMWLVCKVKGKVVAMFNYQVQGFPSNATPEPDLIHATGCKHPSLRLCLTN